MYDQMSGPENMGPENAGPENAGLKDEGPWILLFPCCVCYVAY